MCRTSIFNGTNTNRSMAIVFEAFLFSLHVSLCLFPIPFAFCSAFTRYFQCTLIAPNEWSTSKSAPENKSSAEKSASNASRRQKKEIIFPKISLFSRTASDQHSLTHIYCVYCLVPTRTSGTDFFVIPTRKSRRRSLHKIYDEVLKDFSLDALWIAWPWDGRKCSSSIPSKHTRSGEKIGRDFVQADAFDKDTSNSMIYRVVALTPIRKSILFVIKTALRTPNRAQLWGRSQFVAIVKLDKTTRLINNRPNCLV